MAPWLLDAVERRNEAQKQRLFEKIHAHYGGKLTGLTFGIWGLAFKPGTDDMREAPSLELIRALIEAGATIQAHDPVAHETFQRELPADWFSNHSIRLYQHQYDALAGCDAMVLVTEWKPFRNPDFALIKQQLKAPVIFDGRNQYEPAQMVEQGIHYSGIGRGIVEA
jgi:UDPglucose 6-dehydrogenase